MENLLISSVPDITVTDVNVIEYKQRSTPFLTLTKCRKDYGLVLIKEGSLIYNHEDTETIVRSGDILLLNKNETHFVSNNIHEPNKPYEFYVLKFEIYDTKLPLLDHVISVRHFDTILELFRAEYECMEKKLPGYKINAKAILYQILYFICREYYAGIQLTPIQQSLLKAKLYIDENYMHKLAIDDIAGISGYSRTHFKRLFHQQYGMAPIDYITMVRINKAKSMLHSDMFTLGEIAQACGFSNEYYFCRVFKKVVGCTPGKY